MGSKVVGGVGGGRVIIRGKKSVFKSEKNM